MLRSGSTSEIQQMFTEMNLTRKKIISNIIQLVYFMRGSIQYHDMMNMSLVERDEVSTFIELRLEQEGKKLYPVY